MNGRQRSFLRETAKTAAVLAASLEAGTAAGRTDPVCVLLWRAMPFLPPAARPEMEGLIRSTAADDCFEISDWFEGMRRTYGKYSQVLTMCRLLCLAWSAGRPDNGTELYGCAAELLRLLAAAVTAANGTDKPPDLLPVWRAIIRRRRCLFGVDPGARRKLLLALECSIGSRRSERPYKQMVRGFLASDTGREIRAGRLTERRAPDGAAGLYLSLYGALAEDEEAHEEERNVLSGGK